MITKLEKTQIFAKQKTDLTQNTHKQWGSASTDSHQIGIQPKTRLRESSQEAYIWENTIGPSLSVIPGHSTSSGQCSPLGRKDNKVCKRPRS